MVSDPDRWLEWNGFEFDHADSDERGVIRASSRDRRVDGKASKVRPEFRISEFVVSRFEPPRLIQWERSFPDAIRSAPQSLRIAIAPDGAGTEITISFLHTGPSSGTKSFVYWLLRPVAKLVHPFVVRAHLRGKADNISRAFRQETA